MTIIVIFVYLTAFTLLKEAYREHSFQVLTEITGLTSR